MTETGKRSVMLRAFGAAACAVLLLTACSTTATGGATSDGASNAAADPPAAGPPAARATAGQEPPGEPIATSTIPIAFVEGGELEVAVTGMDVVGELMRLWLTFTATVPSGTEDVAIGAVLMANEGQPAAGINPELVDPVHLKAYEAVEGPIYNGTSINLLNGESRTLLFYYAAPQDDVESFDIVLSSQTSTIVDVPFAP